VDVRGPDAVVEDEAVVGCGWGGGHGDADFCGRFGPVFFELANPGIDPGFYSLGFPGDGDAGVAVEATDLLDYVATLAAFSDRFDKVYGEFVASSFFRNRLLKLRIDIFLIFFYIYYLYIFSINKLRFSTVFFRASTTSSQFFISACADSFLNSYKLKQHLPITNNFSA